MGSAKRQAFSLLELVIVVVIIAAIAIPRLSRGTAGAGEVALLGYLTVLRHPIDLYAAEHQGAFPTYAAVADQLTQYTDAAGDAQPTRDATHIYGPYLRKIPPLPVGENQGKTTFTDVEPQGTHEDAGWYCVEATGDIRANCRDGEMDESNTKYNEY